MKTHHVSESRLLDAPARDLYAILADYHVGHPRILPRPPFVSLQVEQGGTGAGTIILGEMKVLGRVQAFRGVVTEPEPGRVLVESYDTGYVTSFTVDPRAAGRQAEVTIATAMPARGGVAGALERWYVTRFLRAIYVRELAMLESVAQGSPVPH